MVVPKSLEKLNLRQSRNIDCQGLAGRGMLVNQHFNQLDSIKLKVVMGTPCYKIVYFTSVVGSLIIVGDETHYSCLICKPDDFDGTLCCDAVVGVKVVQEW